MSNQDQKRRRRGWIQLVAIVAVFVVPWVAALLWEPHSFVNHGDLVEPARPLKPVQLAGLDGASVAGELFKGRWTFVYFGVGRCPENCRQALYRMRQVRLATGKDRHRVRVVFVVTAGSNDVALVELRRQHPQARFVSASPEALARLSRQFLALAPGSGRIYLVDPLGNVMMSYPPEAGPSDMRKDLARLLKVSKIG